MDVPGRGVQVALELWRAADGRLDGALTESGGPVRTFAGVLELLALLEDLVTPRPA